MKTSTLNEIDMKLAHPTWMTKEELDEKLMDKDMEREERKHAMLEDMYLERLMKIESDEDYIRSNWSTVMDNEYDGSEFSGIHEIKESVTIRKEVTALEKDLFKKINLMDLMTHLASIGKIRELVYNNKWGVCIAQPKMGKYPEVNVLHNIKDLLLEGIHSLDHRYERNKFLLIWSSAPEDTVLGRTWSLLPSLDYDDNDMVIAWQNDKKYAYSTTEEIPVEDVSFWSSIYRGSTPKGRINDRACVAPVSIV
jgi:hypothetical protein